MEKSHNYKVSQHIRSYNFPLALSDSHYFEGKIRKISPHNASDCLEIECLFDNVLRGKDSRVGNVFLTRIHSFGRSKFEDGRILVISH